MIALPDPPLRDERAWLREWSGADLVDLLRGTEDPLVRRYRVSVPHDPHGGRAWLTAAAEDRRSGERLELAVCAAAAPTALGSVSLWGIHQRNRDAMMSWWLGAEGRGRGIGAAAVSLLAGWAMAQLGMARIGASIEEDNHGSRRLAERCGFIAEGRLRSFQRLHDGSRVDCLSYSVLAGELR